MVVCLSEGGWKGETCVSIKSKRECRPNVGKAAAAEADMSHFPVNMLDYLHVLLDYR